MQKGKTWQRVASAVLAVMMTINNGDGYFLEIE